MRGDIASCGVDAERPNAVLASAASWLTASTGLWLPVACNFVVDVLRPRSAALGERPISFFSFLGARLGDEDTGLTAPPDELRLNDVSSPGLYDPSVGKPRSLNANLSRCAHDVSEISCAKNVTTNLELLPRLHLSIGLFSTRTRVSEARVRGGEQA